MPASGSQQRQTTLPELQRPNTSTSLGSLPSLSPYLGPPQVGRQHVVERAIFQLSCCNQRPLLAAAAAPLSYQQQVPLYLSEVGSGAVYMYCVVRVSTGCRAQVIYPEGDQRIKQCVVVMLYK